MDTGHIDDHLASLLPRDPHGLRLGVNIEPNASTAPLLDRPVFYLPSAGPPVGPITGFSPLGSLRSPDFALPDQEHFPLWQTEAQTHLNPLAVQPANKFHAEHDLLTDETQSVFDVDVDVDALLIDPHLDDLPQLQPQGEAHDVDTHAAAEVTADIPPIAAVNQQGQGLHVGIDDQVYANEDLPMDRDEEDDLESDSGTESEYVPTRQSSPVTSKALYIPYRPIALARGNTPALAPVIRRAALVGQRKTQLWTKKPKSETTAAPAVLQRSLRLKAFDPLAKKTTFDFIICGLLASDLPAHNAAIRWQAGSQTVIEIVNIQTFLTKVWKKYFAPGRRSFNRQLGNYGFVRVIRRQNCTKGPLLLEKPGLRRDDQVFWAKIRELDVLDLHKGS